jgi:hypothetical protein
VTHDPLLLVAFALWCFVVALAGGLAGLVLGNIRLPAALALASSPAAGAGANIGISAVSAAAAAIAHIRAGRVNWRLSSAQPSSTSASTCCGRSERPPKAGPAARLRRSRSALAWGCWVAWSG